MNAYRVFGGKSLRGEVVVGGAKNACLPILAAAVTVQGVSVIHNCPRITDVILTVEILRRLGCRAEFENNTITIDSRGMNDFTITADLAKQMRSSILFMGGILARFGEVKLCPPGGCAIGQRKIDYHIDALVQMGATFEITKDTIHAKVKRLRGTVCKLPTPSVGATENIMIAAATASGITIIETAAREPEIRDLANFLNAAGAKINGAGTDTIVIEGVKTLHGVEYSIMPDRIISGTLLTAAAITGGAIKLLNAERDSLEPICEPLIKSGCSIEWRDDSIMLWAARKKTAIGHISARPHPGFPTDMNAQLAAYLATVRGESVITDTVFEGRDGHIEQLRILGADISHEDTTTRISGVTHLEGATVKATDLRAGAALIIAGLYADGETVVTNAHLIKRGYEDLAGLLSKLGAQIEEE